MLTSSDFALFILDVFFRFLKNDGQLSWKSWTSTWLFLKLNQFISTNCHISPNIGLHLLVVVNEIQPFTAAHHQYVWAAYKKHRDDMDGYHLPIDTWFVQFGDDWNV